MASPDPSLKQGIRRSPASRVATSVLEAIDDLWAAQDPFQAASGLESLRAVLQRDRLDEYDPSEAFLCIQGAALRFQQPNVWQHALWTNAALVQVCVGPAFRAQRLEQISHSTTTTLQSETTFDEHSAEQSPRGETTPRSYSPITEEGNLHIVYPRIQEVLPAGIIRFTASAPPLSRAIAEAQRDLVLNLCCSAAEDEMFEHQSPRLQWNIPSVLHPVEKMMRFWLESVSAEYGHEDMDRSTQIRSGRQPENELRLRLIAPPWQMDDLPCSEIVNRLKHRSLDWWYALLMTRACSDLVSVGWRPHPDEGHYIILYLLDIAEQGISMRNMTCTKTSTDQTAREERLAATSSAAEAISALAGLGSRGLIPEVCQAECAHLLLSILVEQTCREQHSLYPRSAAQSAVEEDEWHRERETFYSQRSACFFDAADLMWVLLVQDQSSTVTSATLLKLLVSEDEDKQAVLVRVISGALWGKPDSVPGVPSLRLHWSQFITRLLEIGKFSTLVHDGIPKLSRSTVTLALEIVVAIGRLVEVVLVRDREILLTDEWEPLLDMMKQIVGFLILEEDYVATLYQPAEERAQGKAQRLVKRLKFESETVLSRMGDYLEVCSCSLGHLIADDGTRDVLHYVLLRDAAPKMSIDKASTLSKNVVKSWASSGFLPHKQNCVALARTILAEAFAINSDVSVSRYGGYVHASSVRLQALRMILSDEAYATVDLTSSSAETHGDRNPTRASQLCPFTSTKHTDDEHTELVNEVIIPFICLVFEETVSVVPMALPSVQRVSQGVFERAEVDSDTKKTLLACQRQQALNRIDLVDELFDLRCFALSVLVQLFCDPLRTCECGSTCVKLLTEIAHLGNLGLGEVDANADADAGEFTNSKYGPNKALLALKATVHLGTCLYAPFFSIPSLHESIPLVARSLCGILTHATTQCHEHKGDKKQLRSDRLLSFVSLVPLARLRRSYNGGIMLVEGTEATVHFPAEIALLNRQIDDFVDEEGPFVAPFASAVQEQDGARKRDIAPTFFDFQPVLDCVIQILQKPLHDVVTPDLSMHTTEGDLNLQNRFRSSCFDLILNYTICSGIHFSQVDLCTKLTFLPRQEGPYHQTENFTRLRTALAAFQHASVRAEAVDFSTVAVLVQQLLQLCRSLTFDEVISGCKMLIGVFPSISTNCTSQQFEQVHFDILQALMARVRDFVANTNQKHSAHPEYGPGLLLVLYECTIYFLDAYNLDTETIKALIQICFDVASSSSMDKCCRTLAVRCCITALDRLPDANLDTFLLEHTCAYDDDMSIGLNSLTSQLEIPDGDFVVSALAQRTSNFRNSAFVEGVHHFELAKEAANIKAFDRSKISEAAWLCGDHVLTCKVGSERFSGFVEVIIRGTTFRWRELIRLPESISVENPEIPSFLWNDVAPRPVKQSDDSEKTAQGNFMPLDGDPDLISNALALLDRCDQVLGVTSNDQDRASTPTYSPPIANPSDYNVDSEESSVPSSPRYGQTDTISCHSTPTGQSFEGMMMTANIVPGQIDTEDSTSIAAWLREALPDNHVISAAEVERRLQEKGVACRADEIDGSDAKQQALTPVTRLRHDDKTVRAINVLDRTLSLNTHKIALLFASPPVGNQDDDTEVDRLLKVCSASPAFFAFANGLGDKVMTRHLKYFSAGFDTSGADTDGKYALEWIEKSNMSSEPRSLVVYHTVPFMPENMNNRKRHVGNDNVHIVYVDESSYLFEELWAGGQEEETEDVLISGEFGFVTVFVIPMKDAFRVKIQLKPGIEDEKRLQLQHLPGEDIIPKSEGPRFVRRIAVLADIACSAATEDVLGPPTAWELRLKQIRLMHRHIL